MLSKLEKRLFAAGVDLVGALGDASFEAVVGLAAALPDPDAGDPVDDLMREAVSLAIVLEDERRHEAARGLLVARDAIEQAKAICAVALLTEES